MSAHFGKGSASGRYPTGNGHTVYSMKIEQTDFPLEEIGLDYMSWLFYTHGEGVARDNAETLKWYRKAAEQGDTDARFDLYIFANG